jgi:hypothetical protein
MRHNEKITNAKLIAREFTILQESLKTGIDAKDLYDSLSFHEAHFLDTQVSIDRTHFQITIDQITSRLNSLREKLITPEPKDATSYVYIPPSELGEIQKKVIIIGWFQDIKLVMDFLEVSEEVNLFFFDKTEISIAKIVFSEFSNIRFEHDINSPTLKINEASVIVIEGRGDTGGIQEEHEKIFDFIRLTLNGSVESKKDKELGATAKSLTVITTKTFFTKKLSSIKSKKFEFIDFRVPFTVVRFSSSSNIHAKILYRGEDSLLTVETLGEINLRSDMMRAKKSILKVPTKMECSLIKNHYKSFTSPYIGTNNKDGQESNFLDVTSLKSSAVIDFSESLTNLVQKLKIPSNSRSKLVSAKENDIVVSRIGKRRLQMYLLKNIPRELFVPNNCFLLRKIESSNISPEFLYSFFYTKLYKKINPAFQKQTSISSREIMDLEIPEASSIIQQNFNRIIRESEEEFKKAKKIMEEKILLASKIFIE